MTKKQAKFDLRHKETLTLFLKEYFDLFFPDLTDKIDFSTAEFLDKELIALYSETNKQADHDQHRITDALILVQILLNAKWEWILIHWEQESQKKQNFEERMFHYFCGIYFKFRKLVFPIAMFTDSSKWKKPVSDTYTIALLQYPINQFTYSLIKLKNYKSEIFEKQIDKNPLAAAYLPLTDYPKKERPLIKAKALKGITAIQGGAKQATLFSLIQESIQLDGEEEKHFQELMQNDPLYKEVNMLQSVKELGIEEGIEQGIETTAKNLILSGLLTKPQIAKVTGMELKKIDELTKRLQH